jgi:hypothetical protein
MIQTELDSRNATDLLYDLPRFRRIVAQELGRFDRIGRAKELSVYVLEPTNTSDGPTLASLKILRKTGVMDV